MTDRVSPLYSDEKFFLSMLRTIELGESYAMRAMAELEALRKMLFARAHYRYEVPLSELCALVGMQLEECEALVEDGWGLLR